MQIQNKTEIELSIEDTKRIIYESLRKEGCGDGEYAFNFKVINKPYPCGIHDTCDRHEFDGIKVVITK